jgi:hypothetical protein
MSGLPPAPAARTSSKLDSKERDAGPGHWKEIEIELQKEDCNEEESYWHVEKKIPTESMISENDRISALDSDFAERSARTFQLDEKKSWVDVHVVCKSTFLY